MSEALGRGVLGSLRARVRAEIAELFRDNKIIRRARHPMAERLLRGCIVGRSLLELLLIYGLILGISVLIEWAWNAYLSYPLPGWRSTELRGFLKDFAGFFITAQVGILAIVTVAVGVVTLLSQRNDGASATTNIRLYYSESYAYEVATSGVALLLVLVFQIFWPLQHALHAMSLGGMDLAPKVALTAAHAAWLGFNFVLFLRFIVTTLRFVEPAARTRMRERYTASTAIPDDLAKTLLSTLYGNAALELFGPEELKMGPEITFGHAPFSEDDAAAEIDLRFDHPVVLKDVWFRPLSFALHSWIRRTRKMMMRKPTTFDSTRWEGELIFPIGFSHDSQEAATLLMRKGGAPLTWWERFLIRHSFRFAKPPRRQSDVPTPTQFIEDLVDELAGQIEKSAVTGFKAALNELVAYHSFVLAAMNTRDTAGNALNFAEIGGVWGRVDQTWIRQYRHAYQAAADKIGEDTEFIDWLGSLGLRLFPSDPKTYSRRVLRAIIDVGIFEVIALEAWVTAHTLPSYDPEQGSRIRLAGNDQSSYERVLLSFVGSWESLQQTISIAFGLRKIERQEPVHQWSTLGQSWPILEAHLHACAYFLTSAVWNEDEAGSDRFRDMLLRWLNPFYSLLGHDYEFRHHFLLTPDLLGKEWNTVEPIAAGLMRYQVEGQPRPAATFGLILSGAYEDLLMINAAVTLSWFAREQQATDIGARVAIQSVRRQPLDEGADLTAAISQHRSVFRLTFEFLLRHALNPGFGDSVYGASLDELVRYVSGVAIKRMVPGRIYSGWGLEGIDGLRPALLAIMAANMPEDGDEGALRIIGELVIERAPLSDSGAARRFVSTLDVLISTVGQMVDPLFERAVRAFDVKLDVEACRARLQEFLSSIRAAVQSNQQQRLANAPLDLAKIEATRRMISEALLANGPDVHCFQGYALERGRPSDVLQSTRFGVIDRGAFSNPHMSAISFDEYARIIVEESRHRLGGSVWQDFFRRERETVEVDLRQGLKHFWRSVIAKAATVGDQPTILVPYDNFGEAIGKAAHGLLNSGLDEFQVARDANMSGGGITYLGTIEGVRVYSAIVAPGTAPLFSGSSLQRIRYGVVAGQDDVADFSFVDGDNPADSWVLLKFAQATEWDETRFVEFRYSLDSLAGE